MYNNLDKKNNDKNKDKPVFRKFLKVNFVQVC